MNLTPATIPAFLKIGFFGTTGTGKTYTAAKVMAQFVKMFCPGSQIAAFDTEPAMGFVAPMVKEITGKELITCVSRSFSDLIEFTDECIKNKYVAIVDSITHPWRNLCTDYLDAKKSRVSSAGGRQDTVRLSLKDWGPLKDIWNTFSEKFVFSPIHFCICGREGDAWDTVTDEEGKEEMKKVGVKMKTETEFGHEPSLLVQMKYEYEKHVAFVAKDRFAVLTGKTSGDAPDIDFFMPHINLLDLKGKQVEKSEGKKVFTNDSGPNWETIKAQRTAILENIKDDLLLSYPSTSAEEKKAKVEILREAFNTSSWTELEEDHRKFPVDFLNTGREKMSAIIKGRKNGQKS